MQVPFLKHQTSNRRVKKPKKVKIFVIESDFL